MRIVELRSDTKTKPTLAMREAMFAAEVGDDVSGEDPTVNRLEELAAEMLGKEAALFVVSGTMGNLSCVLTHCRRGHEVILGEWAHIYWAEVAGAAALGGISYRPLPNQPDGTIEIAGIAEGIRPPDLHYAQTGLICLENSHNRMGGTVLSLDYMAEVRELADRHGIPVHLDGARLFNAAVYLDVAVAEVAAYADSVQICLSKGLGAPVGSVVAGTAEFVARARKVRKMLGGGMRQAGIIAAAGIVALEQHVDRLRVDHANARLLAEGMATISGLDIDPDAVQTNIVNVRMTHDGPTAVQFETEMAERGVLFNTISDTEVRMVTHLDVTRSDILWALEQMTGLQTGRKMQV
ncbi:MAG: low-specificity L-threonine aldolase [Actinobacteria bacterium]|nr:low-specificity L-threonine aldolase [Actinomycetota bacterium]